MYRHEPHNESIGIFDSGVGGLTVMQQVVRLLPHESVVYFGDTARVPYGSKSRETIQRYSIENTIFLMEQNIKLLIVACNTASAYAAEKLKQVFNIPIVGVIVPAAERAVQVTKNGNIAILGTKGTVLSGVYQKEILQRMPKANITAIACPLWVPLVEELFIAHPATKAIVKEYLKPLHNQNIDTVVLGCTHYPLLRPLIEEELGSKVTIVDPAIICAETVSHLLQNLKLHTQRQGSQHKYFVSDDPEKFRSLGRDFLGMPLTDVEALPRSRNFE